MNFNKKMLILTFSMISSAFAYAGIELEVNLPENIKTDLVKLQSKIKLGSAQKTRTRRGYKYPVMLDKKNLRLGLQFITKDNLSDLTNKKISSLKDAVQKIADLGLKVPVAINLTNAEYKLVPYTEGTFKGWRLLVELDTESQSQAFKDFQKLLYEQLAEKSIPIDTGASLYITLGFTRFDDVKNAIKDLKFKIGQEKPFTITDLILTTVNLDVKPTTINIKRDSIDWKK